MTAVEYHHFITPIKLMDLVIAFTAANITKRKTTGNHVCLAGKKNLFYEILLKKKLSNFLNVYFI